MPEFSNLTNHFLIATPSMLDPNFFQTVIYICEHSPHGALGIVINRPTSVKLVEILEQMQIHSSNSKINALEVLYGGPVHQERGFVIHRPEGNWRSSFMPSDQIVITTSRDILQAIADDKGPAEAIVTLGYVGWGAGQLEEELKSNTWLNCEADENIIFSTPYETRWQAAAALIGIHDIYNVSGEKRARVMNNTYLGFDYGLKRIGVAVGQDLTKSASPLQHLIARNGVPQWDHIEKLIKAWKPKAIIVGIPFQLDDSEQELTNYAREFAKQVHEKFNIEVHGVDERLSTKEARSRMFETGGYKALKKGVIDSVAAKVILEAWLRR